MDILKYYKESQVAPLVYSSDYAKTFTTCSRIFKESIVRFEFHSYGDDSNQ
jgi:hypothetical protein